jgi:bifunctional non-homologous end joining protein LigD
MLAVSGPLPVGPGWAYEVKWDGVRVLVRRDGSTVTATTRLGNEVSSSYPELRGLDLPEGVVDGELVALVDGKPDFGALQNRMHVRSPSPALRADTPVTFLPFDVLELGNSSLLDQPYDARRTALEALDLEVPPAFDDGQALLDTTRAQGLEGVVAKRRSSPYLPGRRSPDWVKVKHVQQQSAVVCGWKAGVGGREGGIGSLLLGVHDPELTFAGFVGTGFTAATLRLLEQVLAPLVRTDAPLQVPADQTRDVTWVEPVLVVEVEFTAWTRDGRLRHPSYKGIRTDVDPREVVRE